MVYTLSFNQRLADGSVARSHLAFEDFAQAKSRFHLELAQVTINPDLKEVNAEIKDDYFNVICRDTTMVSEEEAEPAVL